MAKIIKIFTLLLTLLTCQLSIAEISVEADKTVISEFDRIQLTVRLTGNTTQPPDMSAVEELFEVEYAGQIGGSSFSISIGGNNSSFSSSTNIFQYILKPRKAGEFIIPALKSGNDYSEPFTIKVLKAEEAANHSVEDFFIKDSISSSNTFAGANVFYRVKVYQLAGAMLKEIKPMSVSPANGVIFEKIRDAKKYKQRVNGQIYIVYDFSYLIKPEQPGSYTISPITAAGVINDGYGRGKPVYVNGQTFNLEVKPRPYSFKNSWWIPAKSLTISEKISPNKNYKQGEPINREITITATGVTAEQLPDMEFRDSDNMKIYPDKAGRENSISENSIKGTLTQKVLYIPNMAGEMTLPEIKIRWWDTVNEEEKFAVLPAKTVEVLPSANAQTAPQTTTQVITPKLGEADIKESSQTDTTSTPQPAVIVEKNNGIWLYLFIAALVLWLVTIIITGVIISRINNRKAETGTPNKPVSKIPALLKELKQSTEANDPAKTREILIQVVNSINGNRSNLSGIDYLLSVIDNDQAKLQLMFLQNHLYGKDKSSWNGQLMWQTLNPYLKKISEEGSDYEIRVIKPFR